MWPRRKHVIVGGLILAIAAGGAGVGSSATGASRARHALKIDPANFTNKVDNPYLPWEPGTAWRYVSSKPGQENPVTVTHKTKKILGVKCVVVRDVGTANGRPEEKSLDWYAQDKHGNVWYFGEASSRYKNGHWVRDASDSWKSGVRGARPGIIMEAHPQEGDRYRQEVARRDDALDTAKVLGYVDTMTVPYGTFHDVLKIEETSPLEPGVVDHDFYAIGIGEIEEDNVKGGEGTSKLVLLSH